MEFVKIRKISDNQKLFDKFLINPRNLNWGREGALAKRLISEYGIDFLLWVKLPDDKKINSLLWLSDESGKNYLKAFLLEFKGQNLDLSNNQESIKLSENKIGIDVEIKKTPKTLIDFLNKYK